jgi:hypothetical protein
MGSVANQREPRKVTSAGQTVAKHDDDWQQTNKTHPYILFCRQLTTYRGVAADDVHPQHVLRNCENDTVVWKSRATEYTTRSSAVDSQGFF